MYAGAFHNVSMTQLLIDWPWSPYKYRNILHFFLSAIKRGQNGLRLQVYELV